MGVVCSPNSAGGSGFTTLLLVVDPLWVAPLGATRRCINPQLVALFPNERPHL